MIFKEQFTMQLKDIGKENYMKNRAILEIFENIGTHHSDIAGYGPNDIRRTGVTWVLLDWKVQVLKRPKYGEKLNVSTWGRTMKRTYTYRDFEMYDEENNLCVIGTSKWVLIDIETGRISKITEYCVYISKSLRYHTKSTVSPHHSAKDMFFCIPPL